MDWLQSIDVALFRFINIKLGHPALDVVMPLLSGNTVFIPALILLAIWVIWKGSLKSRLCLALCVLALALGDGLVCDSLKEWVGRPRPFNTVADAHVLGGRGESGSFPSSHTANWFAMAGVLYFFYRKSLKWILPLACMVGFSRVYNGMHYPSDVLGGALIGLGYSLGGVWLLDTVWMKWGGQWFPEGSRLCPSLRDTASWRRDPAGTASATDREKQWLHLGYALTLVLCLFRLWYVGSDKIQLSEDEAYQWLWSKHPALSYYSKPPLIAYTQWIGTHLWGDTAFGIRFFAPLLSAFASLLMLRFLAREVNARAAFWCVAAMVAAPMPSVGSILMTIDPLNVFFWLGSMLAGWRAIQSNSTRWWLLSGLCMGLSFLAKYTALFQLLSWAVFFVLWKPARAQLRRPGPWLAILMIGLCSLPVLIWNAQHGWITVTHLSERGGLANHWRFRPNYLWDFFGAGAALLNPVFFVAAIWAMAVCHRRHRQNAVAMFLLSMAAPVFLFYALWTIRARVQPNWIAPAVVPMFMLMAFHWDTRWQAGVRAVRTWLQAGMFIGVIFVVVLHDTNLVSKVTKKHLPVSVDPLRRVRGWDSMAATAEKERVRLASEGRPAFIITGHYGLAGMITFYLPEAKAGVPDNPLVYYQSSATPQNQFYFWPGYEHRKGQSAVYVLETDEAQEAPERLRKEFESVKSLGLFETVYRGRNMRTFQLFECRNLL